MIYEVRTYNLKPGSVPEFEENFAKALPAREKYSKLGAFWHTEFGPLNQVIHVWPYESVEERNSIRAEAGKDPDWPPKNDPDMYINMNSEIFYPAPFMRPLGDQELGNIYEMRTYTYAPGDVPKVVEAWGRAIHNREEFSPLAAGMYTELGGLNKWTHIWVYKDLNERARVRTDSRKPGTGWPAQSDVRPVKQENKILIPASFSPVK